MKYIIGICLAILIGTALQIIGNGVLTNHTPDPYSYNAVNWFFQVIYYVMLIAIAIIEAKELER